MASACYSTFRCIRLLVTCRPRGWQQVQQEAAGNSNDAAQVLSTNAVISHERSEEAAQPAAAPQLRRRSPTAKLASTSNAGAALHNALQTAKAQLAESEVAAAASSKAARWVLKKVQGMVLLCGHAAVAPYCAKQQGHLRMCMDARMCVLLCAGGRGG